MVSSPLPILFQRIFNRFEPDTVIPREGFAMIMFVQEYDPGYAVRKCIACLMPTIVFTVITLWDYECRDKSTPVYFLDEVAYKNQLDTSKSIGNNATM